MNDHLLFLSADLTSSVDEEVGRGTVFVSTCTCNDTSGVARGDALGA